MAKPAIQVNMHYHSIYKINFDALNSHTTNIMVYSPSTAIKS